MVEATVDTDTTFPTGYETACTNPEIPEDQGNSQTVSNPNSGYPDSTSGQGYHRCSSDWFGKDLGVHAAGYHDQPGDGGSCAICSRGRPSSNGDLSIGTFLEVSLSKAVAHYPRRLFSVNWLDKRMKDACRCVKYLRRKANTPKFGPFSVWEGSTWPIRPMS